MKNANIKLIISDIDGTLVEEDPAARPSIETQKTIARLVKHKVKLCLATGRAFVSVQPLLKFLPLDTLIILSGGSIIYELKTKKFIWKRYLEEASARQVTSILIKNKIFKALRTDNERYTKINDKINFRKILQIVSTPLTRAQIEKTQNELKHIKSIHFVETGTWESNKELKHLQTTHVLATKQYAVFAVLKYLNISREYTLGIGDGHNDIPLLSACGVKIAMGNADPRLKQIADFTTKSQEENGFSHAISKFIT